MSTPLKVLSRPAYWTHQDEIHLKTIECLQFIDLTEQVQTIVESSGVSNGMVTIQSLHTTTAVLINEHEPLLLQDLKRTLERVAPRNRKYRHDDFTVRTVNMTPDEEPNGHAHCKALFLPTSVVLNVLDGKMLLGRWQRLFMVELDRPRKRTISVLVFGV